ncbi:MAG: HDOD domain-containing protein, partial [Gammaproteobacteria bacterium]
MAEKELSLVSEQVDLPVLPVYPPILRCLNACHARQEKTAAHMLEIVVSDPALTFLACRFATQQSGANTGNPGFLLAQIEDMPSEIFLAITRWSLAWQHAQQTPLLNEGSHYFWHRALNHAFVAQSLAEKTGLFTPDSGYMMGLFLDLGRLDFLKKTRGQYLADILSLSPEDRLVHER